MKIINILLINFIIISLGLLSGCISDQSDEAVNVAPNVSCLSNITNGTAPLTVNFSCCACDSDGVIVYYRWDFDDGKSSDSRNTTHTFNKNGTYHVVLTVTDDDGLYANDNITINVVNSLYWISLVNQCNRYLEVVVETKTDCGMIEKKFDLKPYWLRFLLRDYQQSIIIRKVGLLTGGNVSVTVEAYYGRTLFKRLRSTIMVPSAGNSGIEFIFHQIGTPEGLVTYNYMNIIPLQ